MRSHVGPAKNLLDFCRELPGGGGAVEVVLLPWCGGATGVLLPQAKLSPQEMCHDC